VFFDVLTPTSLNNPLYSYSACCLTQLYSAEGISCPADTSVNIVQARSVISHKTGILVVMVKNKVELWEGLQNARDTQYICQQHFDKQNSTLKTCIGAGGKIK